MVVPHSKIKIAVFASGSGSNAEAIAQHFTGHEQIELALIVTNRKNAGVIERAKRLEIPCEYLPKSDFDQDKHVLNVLESYKIDWIVLAGWLLLVPKFLIDRYPECIINIHPALLPKYGGKGMYGSNVHRAVSEAKELESGITVHLVNEEFDQGKILAQHRVSLPANPSPEQIETLVRRLELEHYAIEIERSIL